MAEAVVSVVLEQLISPVAQEIRQELGLVLGVDKEVEKLSSNFKSIQAGLVDAEQRQVKETRVKLWLDKLKDLSYDMEDVLDEWNTAMLKARTEGDDNALAPIKKGRFSFPSPCFCFDVPVTLRRGIALKIKKLNEDLNDLTKEKDIYDFRKLQSIEKPGRLQSTSVIDMSEIFGRVEEKSSLISNLLSEGSEELKGVHIISIVGMAGIGKTTLAQFAYNDKRVMSHFDKRVWVCVSDPFDEYKIAKSIIQALEGTVSYIHGLEYYLQHISQCIVGKKYLLVLDDVWTEDYSKWESLLQSLKNGLQGSKILITTRKESVAFTIGSIDTITVKELSEEECWSMFKQIAFCDRSFEERPQLEGVGKKIVYKCKGLPLAIKTIASVLRFKKFEEWQSMLDSDMWKLEEFESGTLSPLWLSYNDLPSMVRQCFSFCAIFPKGYHMNKDELIKLWMAQGYLRMDENEDVETVGQECFDLLMTQSLFQEFEKDDDGNIIRCMMHDIVHDFARSLAKNEFLTVEVTDDLEEPIVNSSHEKPRHSMLVFYEGVRFPESMCSAKMLRSLLIQYGARNCSSISKILPKLLEQLTSLRALDLSGKLWYENLVIEIPIQIGKLTLLRYLNLSSLQIKYLPNTLCELYNLQTLDISWCTNLKELPQRMGRLINLRHIVNEGTSLSYMPKGLENLTRLRTLSEFVVTGVDDRKACSLACLKFLNHLQGTLCIKNLGTVRDTGEVEEAELQNKAKVIRLHLNFEDDAEKVRMDMVEELRRMITDEIVLSVLKPPPYVELLEIKDYYGKDFHYWMWSLSKLSKLRTLNLHNCTNIEDLPPLGELPSLESLSIWSMGSVKRVGNEFMGIESDGASSSSSVIPFPKLQSLTFGNMEEWEDWNCGIVMMPCLQFLSLVHCPKLKALPDHILQMTTLVELNINWCPILKQCYERWKQEDLHISHVHNIMINFEYVQRDRP